MLAAQNFIGECLCRNQRGDLAAVGNWESKTLLLWREAKGVVATLTLLPIMGVCQRPPVRVREEFVPDFNLTLNSAFTAWGLRRIALLLLLTARDWSQFAHTPVGVSLYLLVAAVLLAGLWEWVAGPSPAVQAVQVVTVLGWMALAGYLLMARRWRCGQTD